MSRPLLHPTTSRQLAAFARALPHALIIHGQQGSGLRTVAEVLAQSARATLHWVYPERDDKVDLAQGSVGIEQIRALYQQTRTTQTSRQCYVIVGADTMSPAAQNAFLKLLEEPVASVAFVLLSHQLARLLPTVRSRAQQLRVVPLEERQSELLLDSLGVTDPTRRRQLLFLASGRAAQLTRLAGDQQVFEHHAGLLRQARDLVSGSSYRGLVIAQQLKSSRPDALAVVDYALDLLAYDTRQKGRLDPPQRACLERLEHALVRLRGNANIRLALASAVV